MQLVVVGNASRYVDYQSYHMIFDNFECTISIVFLIMIKDDETTSTSSIIGSIVAVVLVVAVVVIGIFIWKRNRRYFHY